MRKLDADVLSRFQKLVPEFRKKAAEKTENANGEIERLLTQIMVDLLVNSPEFEIKQLRIRTDKGDLNGRAKLTFGGLGKNLAGNILGSSQQYRRKRGTFGLGGAVIPCGRKCFP